MTSLAALWLPILLSAVFVFIASSIIHMVLPVHKSDYKKLPDEDKVRTAIRESGATPGFYMFPGCENMKELETPEMQAKLKEGPLGTMILRPPGSWGMGPALAKWFGFIVIISVFTAYLAGIGNAPGAESVKVFQVTGAVSMLGYAFSMVHEWTWKGLPAHVMVKFFVDGVVYALVTAATFAWLWPAAA